ncbi:hypothetical protein ACLMJK_006573 [Lecanora helva]
MPRQKEFLHRKRKTDRNRTNEVPKSENEYLAAAGVDLEEAGEKWRAGDAAKSLRFFIRATETYAAGLQKFPQSFDLAYNKARLQFDVTQQPRLLQHLPTPLIDLLHTALDSHRAALQIQQDTPDLLFNTAQVLTSLSEAIVGQTNSPENDQNFPLRLLQEALELFQRCLNLQEFQYDQTQEDAADASEALADHDIERDVPNGNNSDISEDEVWASLEEPITKSSLFDTTVAQLSTLTSICGLDVSQDHSNLAWSEEYYRTTLQDKVKLYVGDRSQQHEAALAKAKFAAAISDAAFRNGRLSLLTYQNELNAAFESPELDLSTDPRGLCDKAEAELTFITSLQALIVDAESSELPQVAGICWKHITKALDSLTAASKLPDVLQIPRIHIRRGDCEMFRNRLGEPPLGYDFAVKSKSTLLKNAEIYYRGAATLASKSSENEEEQTDAQMKEAIALALSGDTQKFAVLVNVRRGKVEAAVEDMHDDNLLGEQSLQKIVALVA